MCSIIFKSWLQVGLFFGSNTALRSNQNLNYYPQSIWPDSNKNTNHYRDKIYLIFSATFKMLLNSKFIQQIGFARLKIYIR